MILDGQPLEFRPGDTVLVAMLRAGRHPTGGGCLCLAGDCPHCLAIVDGVAYVRTCQVQALDATVVIRQLRDGPLPPLESRDRDADAGAGDATGVPVHHRHCDVVVIGQGEAGRAAAAEARAAVGAEGRTPDVVTLDARDGQDVIGIYPGPLVVARTSGGMLHVMPRREIVVATGAAEIQPVAPGNLLAGLVTARAATALAAAGVALGRVVAIGTPPDGLDVTVADGTLVRFEPHGPSGSRIAAVVVRDAAGAERRHACDTVSIGLGLTPRDGLLRMGRAFGARAVGDAALDHTLPPCPAAGTVCPCSAVTVEDLDSVHGRGFCELDLVKRATLAGTGPCQGAACVPHIRAWLASRGGVLQPPFTARPVAKPVTLGEAAAGAHHHPTPRTALDAEHRRLGARMERLGGWWRPWHYGDPRAEYDAVRHGVSIADVGTLGKMRVSGPDAVALLEHLYPVPIASLAAGRSRYVVLLDERGYVLDDGLVCREAETRFTLTFTSGGATLAELWVRDWADALGTDVRLLNQTMSRGAINVTGPRAGALLARAGAGALPGFMRHAPARIAGVACHVYRLSFTGEPSYELHHDAGDSVALWRALLDAGAPEGVRPHGLQALLALRLEKGHIVVGQDTDFDSTPRRLGLDWAVRTDKPAFVGRDAVIRTNRVPLDRQLVGLEVEGEAPPEGAVIWRASNDGGDPPRAYAGYVTSSAHSPVLGRSVMLGWVRLHDGALPDALVVDGRSARRVATPFYDPGGDRARA
ncbi:MAG: glycine cleavage T C-terminal barrel domain-containing protein [Vicinamibacterales bacterium]